MEDAAPSFALILRSIASPLSDFSTKQLISTPLSYLADLTSPFEVWFLVSSS